MIHVHGIECRMSQDEADLLTSQAKAAPEEGWIVELGVFHGGATALLCEAVGDGRVVGVDHFKMVDRGTVRKQLKAAGFEPRLTQATTVAAASGFLDDSVAFLFIDANHRHPHPMNDYRTWERTLKHDAVVAFHDYGRRPYPEISAFCASLIADRKIVKPQVADTLFVGRFNGGHS